MSPEERNGNATLESLIAKYLEAEKSGQNLDRDALIAEHPDLADSLREFFANHDGMKSAANPNEPTVSPNGSSLNDPTMPPREVASQSAEASVGDKVRYFGDYELLEEIARGGMGVVFRARQINLNRIVALKMILSGEFAGEEDVIRFHTEAEAAAQLDHPGIVPIFEIGEHQGQHYFSMGYVEGESLADKVADGPLPPREAAELVKKICDAMAYAHQRGVIHRDLKPANILIEENGQPKVTDFGLAKKTQADSNLTGTGQILGTPAYMPPEQASGKTDVGPLVDVYSFGAILYCLLTGRPPFRAASPMDTLLQVLDQEPAAPRILNPTIPRDLSTICLKCLEKETENRYRSANEVHDELERFLNGYPIHARPVGRLERAWRMVRRHPVRSGLAASFLLLMLAIGIEFQRHTAMVRHENLVQSTEQAVASMRVSRGLLVPRAIQDLRELPEQMVIDELNARFMDSTPLEKMSLAYALANYGDVQIDFLVSQVAGAPPAEAAHLVEALGHAKLEATEAINSAASPLEGRDDALLRHKSRLAMLSLHLGESSLASEMCQLDSDLIERTVFIDECSSWCGDLLLLSVIASRLDDASLRSAICLCVGGVSPDRVKPEQRDTWHALLADWHRNLPDNGTHSASGWAIRQWELPVPELSGEMTNLTGPQAQEHKWYVNSAGLTSLRIPAEEVSNYGGALSEVERDFLISDQEISVALFHKFVDDPQYPESEKPKGWRMATRQHHSRGAHYPVAQVSWYDAVMFCNWLSQKDGLFSCYRRTGEKADDPSGRKTKDDAWDLNEEADGYRLPTEAEWEHACRAGTTTFFSCGGDPQQWLDAYGVYRTDYAAALRE